MNKNHGLEIFLAIFSVVLNTQIQYHFHLGADQDIHDVIVSYLRKFGRE